MENSLLQDNFPVLKNMWLKSEKKLCPWFLILWKDWKCGWDEKWAALDSNFKKRWWNETEYGAACHRRISDCAVFFGIILNHKNHQEISLPGDLFFTRRFPLHQEISLIEDLFTRRSPLHQEISFSQGDLLFARRSLQQEISSPVGHFARRSPLRQEISSSPGDLLFTRRSPLRQEISSPGGHFARRYPLHQEISSPG